MSYEGYRVKINGIIVPNLLISSGSYSFVKARRLIRSWTDAKGLDHFDYFKDRKVTIKFSIRERNVEEQESIKGIFTNQEKITVEYWDDYSCSYAKGTFQMAEPNISHRKGLADDILYNTTEIKLEEY